MDFKKIISQILHKETGISELEIVKLIEVPPDSNLGDYAVPCFMLAKALKKSPQNIALELQEKITKINLQEDHKHFEVVKNIGPYLNFFVNKEVYIKNVLKEIYTKKYDYGKGELKNKKVMIEFGQANTHKEFHVGHLRNVCLGDSLVRIYRFNGYEVISANYPGDIGTHVAKTLWYYQKFHKNEVPNSNKGKFLGKMYSQASKFLEENDTPENRKEVSQVLQKLENDDEQTIKLWMETRKWSLDQMREIFSELHVNYDVYFFESQVEKESKKIVDKLLQEGIAVNSEGAVIVDLKDFNLDVFLVLKSDGTSLYSTKDLELAKRKFEEHNIDKSYYVVDTRQSMYFKQLFKTLEIMGFHKDMHHIAYDFVTTKEGAMSSREGNVVLYEDLKENVLKILKEETKTRHASWDDVKIHDNSMKIMISALKFGMLKYEPNRIIVFDMEDWLKFEGETGPYIEYSYARINSIFRKLKDKENIHEIEKYIEHANVELLKEKNEFEIIKTLESFKEEIIHSATDFKPSIISRYLLNLAQQFNEFYHANPIISIEDKELTKARIYLIYNIQIVLKIGLELLGIEVIEEM